MLQSILTVVVFLPVLITSKGKWSYENIEHWSSDAHYCQGNRQSPIDLRFDLSQYEPRLKRIILIQTNSQNLPQLTNNGHTVHLNLNGAYKLQYVAPLSGEYIVEQLHFHWGNSNNNTIGSEHLLESQSYPLEMHIVSYSKSFSNIGDAMSNVRALAVIGVFFELSTETNKHLQPIIDAMEHIKHHNAHHLVSDSFSLELLLGVEGIRNYYRYDGSLTTPPCFESVIWTVLQKPLKISLKQLNAFHQLIDGHNRTMKNTFRPVLSLGARKLFRSFRLKDGTGEPEERRTQSGTDGQYSSIYTRVYFIIISIAIIIMI